MTKEKLLCCFFPTIIMSIDDNQLFSENIKMMQAGKNPVLKYNNPELACSVIKKSPDFRNYTKNIVSQCICDEEDMGLGVEDLSNLNVSSIYKKIYDPHRFEYISVVLVDYEMPLMNGVEFCRCIQECQAKKIMVTGEADYQIAVSAFNENIIDKFIMKNPATVLDEIQQVIVEKQQQYFERLTDLIIVNAIEPQQSFLFDKKYIEFFDEIYRKNKGVEYYLVDTSGSYLFLDKQGNPYWLLVKSEREMQEFHEIASQSDAPSSIVKELANRTSIPFFLNTNDKRSEVVEWQKYMHRCNKLEGSNQNYYYAIKKQHNFGLDFSSILSFSSFLKNWD